MSKPASHILIGIDGGGTRCRFAIKTNRKHYEIVLAGANTHTDRATALATLKQGLSALREKAQLSQQDINEARCYAGLAGIVNRRQAEELEQALPIKALLIEDDRRGAVVGALGTDHGAVAGIGTGSFVARQSQSGLKILGGYGADLGDEASGCWLGKMLLGRTLHWLDGLAPHSDLIDAAWQRFDADLETLLSFAKQAKPSQFAELAPLVVEAASANDLNGKALMSEGADYILRCLDALSWTPGEPLCLLGGLAPHYQPHLPANVTASLTLAKGTALDGALLLAERVAENAGALS